MFTVLNELAKWRNEDSGEFDLDGFKMVYIAPMKALVTRNGRQFPNSSQAVWYQSRQAH